MRSRSLSSVALVMVVLLAQPRDASAQQSGRVASPDLAETFAIRAVLSQLITSRAPSAAIAKLGLHPDDEQIVRAELASYSARELPLREDSERLARAYARTRRDEDQRARLTVELERATLRADTHLRILQRVSASGRTRWLARIDDARKQATAEPAAATGAEAPSNGVRRASATIVTGRLLDVTCSPVLTLHVDTGAARLRLIIEDPSAVSIVGKSGSSTLLQCGEQDVPVRIGYDDAQGAASGVSGVVRTIDYNQP